MINRSCLSAAALSAVTLLAGCIAPVGPVQVTRFHAADTTPLARGTIAVEAAAGQDADAPEMRTYRSAVARQLVLLGYAEARPGDPGNQVATVRVRRITVQPRREGGPVSVGVGGSTGTYGSGLGVGVGIDLSGPPPAQTETELFVAIRDRASGKALWEGRASFTVRADSPLAETALGAAKVTEALFKGFPGQSGATIEVQ